MSTLEQMAREAAEGVVEDLIADQEAAESGTAAPEPDVETQRQAVVRAVHEAEQPSPGQDYEPEEAAEAETEGEQEPPAAEVEIPPSAPSEWLDEEPDFEAEARAELETEETPGENYTFEDNTFEDDQRLQEERVKRVAAEKRLAHLEGQRLKEARKGWVAEAQEHTPLAKFILGENLEKVEADSHRSFRKKAAEAHEAMRAALSEALGPAAKMAAEEAAAVKAEAKAAAERAYGRPTGGPGAAPANAGDAAAAVAAGLEQKGLRGAIRAMMDHGLNP